MYIIRHGNLGVCFKDIVLKLMGKYNSDTKQININLIVTCLRLLFL